MKSYYTKHSIYEINHNTRLPQYTHGLRLSLSLVGHPELSTHTRRRDNSQKYNCIVTTCPNYRSYLLCESYGASYTKYYMIF